MKIRISNHELMIETRRYNQTSRNDRFCPTCNSGIIEDEFHFLLHCPKYSIPREKFYNQISFEDRPLPYISEQKIADLGLNIPEI